jgi:AbrB family looped-hinge helix DNA binding protein
VVTSPLLSPASFSVTLLDFCQFRLILKLAIQEDDMAKASKPKGLAEGTAAFVDDREPILFSVEVKSNGRILLPAEVRKSLGVAEGEKLRGILKDGELRLATPATILRRMQERVQKLVPPGVSLVDELIAERRAENARDEAEAAEYLARRSEN